MTRRVTGSSRRRVCSTARTRSRRRIPRSRTKTLDFGGLEQAPGAWLEPFERQVRVPRAVQRLHAVPESLEHPPHLAVASLVDRQLDARRAGATNARGRGASVVEIDAAAKQVEL